VALSRKGAKNQTQDRKVRSAGTEAKTRVEDRKRKPPANLKQQLESCRRELAEAQKHLSEAREQLTAASEILGAVARSATGLQIVLDTVCRTAARLCEAYDAAIWRPDGERLPLVAHHGPITQVDSIPLVRGSVVGCAVLDRQTVHIADVQSPVHEFPITSEYARRLGFHTGLWVPLLRGGAAIGVIALRRTEVKPFTERQIALLQTFADQAVIAIENTRLLNELRGSLEQQTATADVLRVISSSAGALTPVFDAMLEKAMHLCEAAFGGLWTLEENRYTAVAVRGVPPAYAAFLAENTQMPGPGTAPYRFRRGEQLIQNLDLAAEEPYRVGDPQRRALVDLGGARTALQVPLRKDDAVLGVITIYRQEVRPFSEKQIVLLQNFARQAVIAIENARLLNELRQRTDDLSESLEHQTATGEILSSISDSITDAKPVFDAIVRNLRRLFGTRFAMVQVLKDDIAHLVAAGGEAEFETLRQQFPRPIDESTGSGWAMVSKQVVQFSPALTDPATPPATRQFARELGFNSVIFAPMLREDKIIGVIGTARYGAEPFNDKQVALIKTFADQAVIAIENVRLFEAEQQRTRELSESLEQQTATSDVLRVISSTPGELKPVFQAMLENAVRICDATFGNLMLYDGNMYRFAALHGAPPAWEELARRQPVFSVRPNSPLGRLATTRRLEHINRSRL
jgi:GAF domain-containing protein